MEAVRVLTPELQEEKKYLSVDSAPKGYAVPVPRWKAPAFLVSFTAAALLLLSLPALGKEYAALLSFLAGEGITYPESLHFRLFFFTFCLTFWPFAAGSWWRRLRLFFFMAGCCLAATLLSDIVLLKVAGTSPFSFSGDLASGFAGMLTALAVLLSQVCLPEGVRVKAERRHPFFSDVALVLSIALPVLLTVFFLEYAGREIRFLKEAALLGGLGPGFTLFSPCRQMVTFALGFLTAKAYRCRRARPGAFPSVAFLVAALNEADQIAECVRGLDRTAANYPGPCRLYLVDNGSTDDTRKIAERELRRCRNLKGTILLYPAPGKARALNFGLRFAREEILVRVDADTVVPPTLLLEVVPYFRDPAVGGVSGLPLPKDLSYWFARMRAVEVYTNIGFGRVAQGCFDGVLVLPGIMAAFRRELLERLGGFAEGINGEDTDIATRVGRLGYRLVVDPWIKFWTEVPNCWDHLRDQRIRWSRSSFHVFARNKSAFWLLQGGRGIWSIPFSLFGMFRRIMVLLTLGYAGIVALVAPSALYLNQGAAVAALVVGPSLLFTIVALAVYRRFSLLATLPGFLLWRVLRAYFALEMLFSLPLK